MAAQAQVIILHAPHFLLSRGKSSTCHITHLQRAMSEPGGGEKGLPNPAWIQIQREFVFAALCRTQVLRLPCLFLGGDAPLSINGQGQGHNNTTTNYTIIVQILCCVSVSWWEPGGWVSEGDTMMESLLPSEALTWWERPGADGVQGDWQDGRD